MKKIIYALFVLLIAIFVLSCSKRGKDTPVIIGINSWTGYDPFILAEQKNLFAKNNVNVKIKRFGSAQDEMRAMREGALQGAGFTMDEAVTLNESGCPVKIVLIIDYSMGGDMVIGKRDVKSIRALKGKRVGYEGSVVGEFLLSQALAANYIKEKDIKLIEVRAENWLSAFKGNTIDALVCFNPVATILLNEEGGNLLFSSKDIPYRIIDVLIFSESFYNENRGAILKIARTWFDALEYMGGHLEETAEIISSQKNITPAEYMQGLKGLVAPGINANKAVFDPESVENIYKYSQAIIDFMLANGLISRRINTDDFFEPSILNELDK